MHKNWPKIYAVTFQSLRWTLALLDIDSEWGELLKTRLPEFFSEEEIQAPVPLSMLRHKADELSLAAGDGVGHDCLGSEGLGACAAFNIPAFVFGGNGDYEESGRKPLPRELWHLCEVEGIGHLAAYDGGQVVVVENGLPEYLYLAPAECIALDQ